MSSPYTSLGLPPDGVAWGALALSPVLALLLARRPTKRVFAPLLAARGSVLILALGAALLSAGYVAFYLRSGPRIVDATSYYLQARAIAAGHFAFPVPAPLGSFNGRFLLANESGSLSVIFPPGYAAVLALGFLAHAPLLVGPLLAALIVLTTYGLALELSGRRDVAWVAAALSVLCAALRYHTADTMSHGLCALLLSTSAWCAMRRARWNSLASGLCCGWLLATRPVSGLVGLVLASYLLEHKPRSLLAFGLGLVPGLALLLAYQHAATGRYFSSTQLAYYALADGPPDCFRYGFGRGIGCLFEHGDYVRARLPNGYGLREAASVTLRRLTVHSIDIANAAPLSALCFVGAWRARAEPRVRAIFLACLGLMLGYAPFYFDASYPGGGARLFADLLPFEHMLLALALVLLRWHAFALPLSLLGFAVHASFAHRALADREGGYPMFQAQALRQAGIDHGLVFVDTDHGFNLGHDPGELDARHQLVVARYEHDAHDFELWDRLARPASYRYSYVTTGVGAGRSSVVPYIPTRSSRFEVEAEWPVLGVQGCWVQPEFFPCASGQRGLRLHPTGQSSESGFDLGVPVLSPARPITVGWVRNEGPATTLELQVGPVILSGVAPAGPADCVSVPLRARDSFSARPANPAAAPLLHRRVRFQASRSGMLDYIEVGGPNDSRAE